MRINASCPQCSTEGKGLVKGMAPFSDDLVVEFVCENGHRTLIAVQAHRFDALISIGRDALIDGCHMEAVSSFNSALERFYEFYVEYRALCTEVPLSVFTEAWKPLNKLSERQLGAFVSAFVLHTKSAPNLIHDKRLRAGARPTCVQFRNNVTHDGYYPTYGEAIAFGQHVLDFVIPILETMKQERSDIIVQMIQMQVAETWEALERRFKSSAFGYKQGLVPRIFVSTASAPGMFIPTLAQEIERRKAERDHF
jgi:hypothetical protein